MAIDKLRSEMRIGFDGVSARFGQVQARFNAIEARFDSVEKRLATIDDRIGDEARATRRHVDVVAEEFKHYREIPRGGRGRGTKRGGARGVAALIVRSWLLAELIAPTEVHDV